MPEPVKNGASKKPAARTDDTVTPPHGDPLEGQVTPTTVSRSDARRREIDMRAAQARWVKKHRQPGR
ncbi:MAG: hypothetical protein IT183_08820 [Acidobacteria bacterium]|nr:hypothetical protein [Acidobacteriota bacterium]